MLPVSAREFHDLGVQETNFGELPIIMGWVREKTPAKDGKSLAKAFTEERNRRRSSEDENFVHLSGEIFGRRLLLKLWHAIFPLV